MRCISVEYGEEFIYLFFYYQDKPSQEEEELAEEVATSVVADFPDIAVMDFEVNKIILPYPFKPDKGNLIVYHRYEPTLRETTS